MRTRKNPVLGYVSRSEPGLSRKCNNLAESSNNENSDEKEDDGTTCKYCKIPWIKLTDKCGDRV